MKSEYIPLTQQQIESFISTCAYGNGRIVIRYKDNKVVLDYGKFIVKRDGKYMAQKPSSEEVKIDIVKRMIAKYQRFEYDGFLYHSPELDIWTREEL